MTKAEEKAQQERIAAEDAAAQPQPTPVEEVSESEKPVDEVVGDYPERPYAQAISEQHLEFLATNHPHRLAEIGITE